MAGLIPIGGGGDDDAGLTCFRCGEPAQGPCAICHVMICASDDCAIVVEEEGIPPAVLCRDCARLEPLISSRRGVAPLLFAAGLVIVALSTSFGGATLFTAIAILIGAGASILALSIAFSRWQWLKRLKKARPQRVPRSAK